MVKATRKGERKKNLLFLPHEKRSHKRSGVLHLRWRYILLSPPIHTIIRSVVVPGWHRVKKKRGREEERTHFCEDCDRSEGIPKVYSYDGLQGRYFYRILRATIRELSIERHSQVLMGMMGVCGC